MFSPRIMILYILLQCRFILDMTAIWLFMKYLYLFLKIKVEKLIESDKEFTLFHKFVILYILFAVFLEFFGTFLRSFFGPFILVEKSNDLPLIKFTDTYRMLVYSISDFCIGIALLYLFYHQGIL